MKLFLDTNIIIDFLANREPFGEYALEIMNQGRLGNWELWTSDLSLATTYYILTKALGEKSARQKLRAMLHLIQVQSATKADFMAAIDSKFKDLEDGIQYYCAMQIPRVDMIVTRNKRDFKPSEIQILSSEEVTQGV